MHYRRRQRYGDPSVTLRNQKGRAECSAPSCSRPSTNRGLCAMHAARLRTTGTTAAPVKEGVNWAVVLRHAAEIVSGYDTGVTLRQVYYRLVADQSLPNTLSSYNQLSVKSAVARREGWFPALIDPQRTI